MIRRVLDRVKGLGTYRRVAVALGAAALLTGGVVAGSALAETPTPTTQTPQGQAQTQPQRPNYSQVFVGKLATALGVDQAKLQDAIKKAESDTVDQAVQDGNLAKNQGDQIKQRIQNGGSGFVVPFGRVFCGAFDRRGGPARGRAGCFGMENQTVIKAAADTLGMTVQNLQTELRAGKSLSDVAKEKGKTDQDLTTAVTAAVKAQLDPLVQSGKLTQQQEDAALQKLAQGNWLTAKFGKPRPQPQPARPAQPAQPKS